MSNCMSIHQTIQIGDLKSTRMKVPSVWQQGCAQAQQNTALTVAAFNLYYLY